MKGQTFAIAVMVGCAVATFLGSIATQQSLYRSQQQFYDRTRFADVFVRARRVPEAVAETIREIPSVSDVQTRLVDQGSVEIEGVSEPINATIYSLHNHPQALNRLTLQSGAMPESDRPWDVVITEPFAKANHLRPGASFVVLIRGHRVTVRVTGTVLSPEYTFNAREGDVMPDDKRFCVMWMQRRTLAGALDMDGAWNDLNARLSDPAAEPHVVAAIDRVLAPYGSLGAYGRDLQQSHRYLSMDIAQLKAVAVVIPSIFLGVAAFLLNNVLVRLIGTQRQQIATLKALGITNGAIALHYAKFVFVLIGLGLILGALGGRLLAQGMTSLYADFYRIPEPIFAYDTSMFLVASALSLGAGLLAVTRAVLRAVSLPPAAAMHPAPPKTYRKTWLERLGIARVLLQTGRIVLRNIARQPIRTMMSTLGLAFSVGLLVSGMFFGDSIDELIDVQYGLVQRESATLTFIDPLHMDALQEVASLPGVTQVEPFRAVPVKLRAGHVTFRTAILGLVDEPRLRRPIDVQARPIRVPSEGLLLTSYLADKLGVHRGQPVVVEVMEGSRRIEDVLVVGVADELVGVSAYMGLSALNRLVREGPRISGAFVLLDSMRERELFRRVKSLPHVGSFTLRSDSVKSLQDSNAKYLLVFASVLVAFAMAIAGGVVYNSARIALAERERELATLRVLGFHRSEVAAVLLGELGVQLVLALPLGCIFGKILALISARAADSDILRIPVVITTWSYVFSMGVVVISSMGVALLMRRRLDRLAVVEVLKTRE